MQTVISADIGTTAVKVSLVERTGAILSTSGNAYPLETEDEQVEQETLFWWDAFCKGL